MRRVLLVALGLLLIAGAAFAQPDSTYTGFFADSARTTWNVAYGGTTTSFTMYIYWLPCARGLQGVEFRVSYPANVIQGAVTSNPNIVLDFGSLKAGISSVWADGDCQPAGVWVISHEADCFLTSAVSSVVQMIPNPAENKYQILTCELGYPKEPVKRFTNLCLNQGCAYRTESKTWGAIKSLFQ
jgi:hypothetical protein